MCVVCGEGHCEAGNEMLLCEGWCKRGECRLGFASDSSAHGSGRALPGGGGAAQLNDASLVLDVACFAGFHLRCLSPPLDAVPDGEWFCAECKARVDAEELRAARARVEEAKRG
eukprot:5637095-Prymnesium_polylepis.1